MALRRMPIRQEPRPGTSDHKFRSDHDVRRGWWVPARPEPQPEPPKTEK